MPDVFLSYSRDDQATARRFAEAFEREGITVWWDQTLNAGENYDDVTEKALEEAKAVVVLWSKKSVASRWVRAEATQADRSGTLVPAMIEPCKRPIMFELKQTADLSSWKGDADDPDWQAYLASVRRLVSKGIEGVPAAPAPAVTPRRQRTSPALIAVAVLALLVVGVGVWMFARTPREATSVQGPAPASATAAVTPSLAVLPFVNLSSDPEQEYFSDGLSEELLNQLAKVPDLRVIGRTSSFAFKGRSEDLRRIGELLGASNLLEGSVQKAGNRVKITAQLINAVDGTHLWSDTYERKLDDIFAIQDEIARTVVAQLKLKLGTEDMDAGGTKVVAAFDELLAGRALLNSVQRESMLASVPHLERAIELDPQYLTAKLWLVDAYTRTTFGASRDLAETFARQDAVIDQITRAMPGSPEASLALSYRAARGQDLQQLERLLRDALQVRGELGTRARLRLGQFLASTGQPKNGVREMEEVRRNDPLDTFVLYQLPGYYDVAGEPERAEQALQQLRRLPIAKTADVQGVELVAAMSRDDTETVKAISGALGTANVSSADLAAGLPDHPEIGIRELRRQLAALGSSGSATTYSRIATWAGYLGDRELALQALEEMSRSNMQLRSHIRDMAQTHG